MKKVYHAHFTVADLGDVSVGDIAKYSAMVKTAAGIISGKETAIKLETEHRQDFDYMITKYYWNNGETIDDIIRDMMADIEKITEYGIEITRWKLEKDVAYTDEVNSDCKYIEVHQELKVNESKLSYVKSTAARCGWHPSNNVRERLDGDKVMQFVNRRFSNTHTPIEIETEIDKLHWEILNSAQISRPRIEMVLIDSNLEHDSWWSSVNG